MCPQAVSSRQRATCRNRLDPILPVEKVPLSCLGADHPKVAPAVPDAELLELVDELTAGDLPLSELPAQDLERGFDFPELAV